jgi:DNA-binding response OmpR family regulator
MPDCVAIVEDDPDQRALLERGLRSRGFSVTSYADRAAARRAFLAGNVPELAILDVNLDGEDPADRDGFELCREMAAIPRAAHVPVIFLTKIDDHRDQLEGLTLAVDYVQKPLDVELLSAKVRSLLAWSRRLHGDAAGARPTLICGELRVDLGSSRAAWKDADLALSYCEFEILRALAERPGRVATYVDLCEALGSSVADNTIATHVQNIRSKFTRVDPQFPRTAAIRAVPRRGYAWETPVDSE